MNITEYADILNLNIEINYYHNQNNRWSANFGSSEIKDNSSSAILKSEYGTGKSPREAIEDYLNLISGKVLVINAMSDNRREYMVPDNLEVGHDL